MIYIVAAVFALLVVSACVLVLTNHGRECELCGREATTYRHFPGDVCGDCARWIDSVNGRNRGVDVE
jgi:predicted amidophosphoribosyltransferase